MKKVRIGILGCANVAGKYAIKAFQAIDNAKVAAIASRDHAKAKEWAAKFSIEAVSSYEALLQRKDIDAVYIPLPIGLHEEWVLKAADAGKHVLCEKSLSDSFVSVKKMVEYCRSKKVVLYENFMCDYHPQHAQVKYSLEKGDLGDPLVFKGYFGFPPFPKTSFRYDAKLGGGSLNDAGAYTAFLARKMFGEPMAVTARLVVDSQTGVDIQGSAFLEFSKSKVGFLSFGFNNVYQNKYSLWGTKGKITVNRAYSIPPDMNPQVELLKNEDFQEKIISVDIPAENHFELLFHDFCETVLKQDRTKMDKMYNQLLSQAKVLEAVRTSSRENRKVLLSEVA